MKIALICTELLPMPPVKGGAVETLSNLILLDNEKEGNLEIDVYSLYDQEAKKESQKYRNSSFIYINPSLNKEKIYKNINRLFRKLRIPYYISDYLDKVIKLISEKSYDFIIVENRPSFIIPLKKSGSSSKLIVHLHNDTLNKSLKYSKKVIKTSDAIFAISKFISQRVNEVTINNKVKLFYNCINTDTFSKRGMRDDIRNKYNLSRNDIVIIFSGRHIAEKGVFELIEAFKAAKKQRIMGDLKLLIIGSPWYETANTNEYHRSLLNAIEPVNKSIIFTGVIDNEEMPLFYEAADIAIVPSIWEEPFGLVVTEAMAMELPVIISDSGAMPEVVDTQSGIIVERNGDFIEGISNAITALANDDKLRNVMGKNGRKRVKQYFDSSSYYEEFISLLSNLKD